MLAMSKKKVMLEKKYRKYVILCAVAAVVIIGGVMIRNSFAEFEYEGLSDKADYPAAEYDMNKFYQNKHNMRAYKDGIRKSRSGIDVSVHQHNIDWEKVKKSGVEFAMIRLGYSDNAEGNIYMDEKFEDNIKEAKKAGIDVGVYFFSQATNSDEAVTEAEYVLKHIKHKGVTMPVAFDMEPINEYDRISDLSMVEKTEIADAFCQVIKRQGYDPVIYGNPWWINKSLDLSYLTDYDIWLAHYDVATDFPWHFKMWQYTDQGIIDGIDGPVDLDVYFK